jgi:DNA invertase Pin-like site-specific DNA recombinase
VDSITYKTLLKSKGIKVLSINEPLDDSPAGQLLEGVIKSIDEFYSANLGQDIKRGMRENAQRGFSSGSRPPYGFHKVAVRDGAKTRYKLEPDPDGSVAVQLVRGSLIWHYRTWAVRKLLKPSTKKASAPVPDSAGARRRCTRF